MSAPAPVPQAERTALYRYIHADGRLLYVGITSHPDNRWKAHAAMPWARDAAERTIEWFEKRSEAEAAEIAAIKAEKPVYNQAHNFEQAPFPCPHWPRLTDAGRQKAIRLAELIRAEIDSGHWRSRHKLPSPREMAEAVGIGLGAVAHAIRLLDSAGDIYKDKSFGYFVSDS